MTTATKVTTDRPFEFYSSLGLNACVFGIGAYYAGYLTWAIFALGPAALTGFGWLVLITSLIIMAHCGNLVYMGIKLVVAEHKLNKAKKEAKAAA